MIILGIETSCDETSVALVENGTTILSNVVSSSSELQKKYGGVYPEIAAREQAKCMIPVLREALSVKREAKRIDAIAVTIGPGLIGSLLVGVETAKTLAFVLNKPIVPVNHVLAHLYANWIDKHVTCNTKHVTNNLPSFPLIALIVSGGHTDLLLMENHGKFKVLGQTLDDAAGEAFDKTARLLGLPYPGGPEIEKIAKKGNPKAFNFPRGMTGSKDYNFSFSGLKTAVLREVKKLNLFSSPPSSTIHNPPARIATQSVAGGSSIIADLAASIQEAIADILVKKTLKAAEEYKPKSILLAGGVAANSRLREKILSKFQISNFKFQIYFPPPNLCTDNAAMIASCAYFNHDPVSWKIIEAKPGLTY